MQYATEQPDAPYDITIYTGTNAEFTLYEDDNETYDYERGEYATVTMRWDDEKQRLSIGERQGRFEGMTEQRVMNVRLVSAGRPKAEAKQEIYDGSPIALSY